MVFIVLVIVRYSGPTENSESPIIRAVSLINISESNGSNTYVSTVGEIESLKQVEIRSQVSERVKSIHVNINDNVKSGDILVRLNNSQVLASLKQAEAALDGEEAKLKEIKRGTRKEELDIQHTNTDRAKIAVSEAKKNLINSIKNAFTNSDNAIRNKVDQLYINPKTQNPKIEIPIQNYSRKLDLELTRLITEKTLNDWEIRIANINDESSNEALLSESNFASESLNSVRDFLYELSLEINSLSPTTNLTASQIALYKLDISSMRSATIASLTSLSGAEEKLNTSISLYNLSLKQLSLSQAGATDEQILGQIARVNSARANVSSAGVQLNKTVIRSPISGKVSSLPVRIGNLVAPGEIIVSVVNTDGLQVKTYINTKDKPLIEEGSIVLIEANSTGVVSRIAPSIDPVTKKVEVIVAVTENLDDILIGEYTNIRIPVKTEISEKTAIFVPLDAVKISADISYVFVVDSNNLLLSVPVKLGRIVGNSIEIIDGIDMSSEIVSSARGLSEGDEIRVVN